VLGGILAVLSSGSSFEKYIKYIASLVCVVIILAPLKSFISGPFSLPESISTTAESTVSANASDEVLASVTKTRLDSYIKDILFNEFGINTPSTDIKIDWTDNCFVISKVTVYLNYKDRSRQSDVKNFLNDKIDKSISVEILEKDA
jgi:hypothetical protein